LIIDLSRQFGPEIGLRLGERVGGSGSEPLQSRHAGWRS
jgi:hypothetical protein